MIDIVQADVLAWAKTYSGPKFHALLCDPPYELSFMGKHWDGTGIAFQPETWAALGEHLLPGAFCMAFSGARTYHRMACAIEDAGFVLHSMIIWCFGSGFPKATRIDTQVDRAAGAEREIIGPHPTPAGNGHGRPIYGAWASGEGKECNITAPATPLAATWAGHRYGLQALKPALEPICVFQKPYAGRPVDSITEYGAGALWVEGGRVGTSDNLNGGAYSSETPAGHIRRWAGGEFVRKPGQYEQPTGRWPSNLILQHAEGCRKIGVKRVKGSSKADRDAECNGIPGMALHGSVDGALNAVQSPGYADADGLETVEAWECVEGCAVNALDSQVAENGFSKYNDGSSNHEGGYQCKESRGNGRRPGRKTSGTDDGTGNGESRGADTPTSSLNIAGCGNANTGQFQQGTMSIIRTTTTQTTDSTILSASQAQNTTPITNDSERIINSSTGKSSDVASGAKSTGPSQSSPDAQPEPTRDTASGANSNTNGNGESDTRTTRQSGWPRIVASPSRFFQQCDWALEEAEPFAYYPKASRRERDAGLEGMPEQTCSSLARQVRKDNGDVQFDGRWTAKAHNPHPTVKPIALARYLATLLLPPAEYAPRRILVPFSGVASECIGAHLAGWEDVLGIEAEAEYVELARARVAYWCAEHLPLFAISEAAS